MRLRRPLLWLLGAAAALTVLVVVAVGWWLQGEDTRLRLERAASTALGVPLKLGGLGVTLYPLPALELDALALQTRPPLTLGRVELRPSWGALMRGDLRVDTLVVRQSVLPQAGIDKLLAALQKRFEDDSSSGEGGALTVTRFLPRRTVLDRLTWVDTGGKEHTLEADAYLDDDAWPRLVEARMLAGRWQGAVLSLRRTQDYEWDLLLQFAGGTSEGTLALQPAVSAGSEFVLKGQLRTRDVELSRLTAPDATPASRAAQPMSGRLGGSTTLSVRGRQPSAVLDALQTQSRLSVRGAVLQELDLAKAAKTAGASPGGKTEFEVLSGEVLTRGRHIELRQLSAKSGVLSASGQVTIPANRRLSGLVNVELVGAVGVPMEVSGTLDDPVVSLTTGAKIGAALGTVMMPGLGTGAGASVGGKIGEGLKKLFGSDPKPKP